MNNSQLLKGTLEGCVLLVISQQEFYGYELVTKLQQLGSQCRDSLSSFAKIRKARLFKKSVTCFK